MIYKIFSVWDAKTEAYMQPFFSPTLGSGIRAFMDASSDPQSIIAKHPGDFSLHHIGEFDDATGTLVDVNPVALGTSAEYSEAAQ
jgi:hypothetical protein